LNHRERAAHAALFRFFASVSKPLLIIPPLTQLNTPYPATAYLTGFLKQQGIDSRQKDLGLDMVLEVFSRKGFEQLFDAIEQSNFNLNHQLDALVIP
jgi:hypothetical protein